MLQHGAEPFALVNSDSFWEYFCKQLKFKHHHDELVVAKDRQLSEVLQRIHEYAVQKSQTEIFQRIIMKLSRKSRSSNGTTPLNFACASLWVLTAKALLEFGADPNQSSRLLSRDGGYAGMYSPLMVAAVDAKSPQLVELLLKHGADLYAAYERVREYKNRIPVTLSAGSVTCARRQTTRCKVDPEFLYYLRNIHELMGQNNVDIFNIVVNFIKKNPALFAETNVYIDLLINATERSADQIIPRCIELIKNMGIDAMSNGCDGENALGAATRVGNVTTLRLLRQFDLAVTAADSLNVNLHPASVRDKLVPLLDEIKAGVSTKDDTQFATTAAINIEFHQKTFRFTEMEQVHFVPELMAAVEGTQPQHFLNLWRTVPEAVRTAASSLILYVCYTLGKRRGIVEAVFPYSNVDLYREQVGHHPFHSRIDNDALCLLISYGVQINVVSVDNGATALHNQVLYRNYANCQSLLEAGADPNLVTIDVDSPPLAYAVQDGNVAIARALLEHGASMRFGNPCSIDVLARINPQPAMLLLFMEYGFDPDEYLPFFSDKSFIEELLAQPRFQQKSSLLKIAGYQLPTASRQKSRPSLSSAQLASMTMKSFLQGHDAQQSSSQSGLSYLQSQGYSTSEVLALKAPAEAAADDASANDTQSDESAHTWSIGELTLDVLPGCRNLDMSSSCYHWIPETVLAAQSCHGEMLDKFKQTTPKFSPRHLKRLSQNESLKGKVIIGERTIDVKFTHELKIPNAKNRLLTCAIPADEHLGGVLYVSCVYLPNGLHNLADQKSLAAKSLCIDLNPSISESCQATARRCEVP